MAKNDKSKHKPNSPKQEIKNVPKEGLLVRLENWFEKNDKKVFLTLLVLSTLFSFLLFDSKVSEGGDDSSYIERAWNFIHEGKYPYFQGPGYPVFLSLFVKMFGLNVIALKMSSLVCQIGFVAFTYLSFRKRIPYTVLFALLAYISFNSYIQYYSSQTFTETFFLFLQSICLFIVFKIIDTINENEKLMESLKNNYGKWIAFGLMFVILSISKSIAFVCIVGVALYFLLKKNYKQALLAIVSFMVIRFIYQQIASALFGPPDSNQLEMMLRKDLYKPELGHEDFSGMIARFFNNFNTYISLHMYRLMNLRSEDTLVIVPPLSYISSLVLGIFTAVSFRKNKFVFFCAIYLIVLCGGVFFGVQAGNMQDRLIIIAIPLIFLVMFFGAYELAKKSSMAQTLLVLFSCFMLLVTVGKSTMKAQKNTTALKKNLAGDIYYGYTSDWENFLKMSRYCADSLPDSAQVLSRKPSMSFLYGKGKKFLGQYIVTTTDADSALMLWQKEKVQYVIVANLRMNPKKNNGKIINTIHRMIGPIYQKYPKKVLLVKSIGDVEKCELYELRYDN